LSFCLCSVCVGEEVKMSFSISSVLEKMENRDQDFRFMATSDLASELQKDNFKLDNDAEKKICAAILKLLDDSSGDVQGQAVKCLGPLIGKIRESQLDNIVEVLGDYILQNNKENLRDIAGIGLKTVITEISAESSAAKLIVGRVTPKLVEGISSDVPEVVLECLGVLNELLKQFATLMNSDHEKIQKGILPHLTSTRIAVRKRAISCLGFLSISTPDNLFADLINYILDTIKKAKKAGHIRTLISVIGAISRSVGFRMGRFLADKDIVGLLIKYLNDEKFESDDELKENCFQTFESLVLRCPAEVKPYLDKIIEQCLIFIKHDPNYAALSDEEEWSEEFSDEEMYSEEDNYSDDDDMSWKVRKAAMKCLGSIVATRADLLNELYKEVVPAVVSRFKEREENVKLDAFATFIAILKQTKIVTKAGGDSAKHLKENIESVVKGLTKELSAKNVKVKTRIGVYQVLTELVKTSPGILGDYVSEVVAGVVSALTAKGNTPTTKMEALNFLRVLLSTHEPPVFYDQMDNICQPVLASVDDSYYKITAESLRVCSALIKVLSPFGQEGYSPSKADDIYDAIISKYEAQDIDQEVKEACITCMGLLIAHSGDQLSGDKLEKALSVLLDRLNNEITRLTCVHALIAIASSPVEIDIKPIIGPAVKLLSAFLRQANRQLKQSSLEALALLIKSHGGDLGSSYYDTVLEEVAPLISESDLHLTHLSLCLVEVILSTHKKAIGNVQSKIYPKVLELACSSLLQGTALQSLLTFYKTLVKANAKKFGFNELLQSLLALSADSSGGLGKQGQRSIAKCVASLCIGATEEQKTETVQQFLSDLKKKKAKEHTRVLALYCLGEIGRIVDLASQKGLKKVILSAFEKSEDEKQAASFALGNVAVGNVPTFLPFVLKQIKTKPEKQYLLLQSLEEIISRCTGEEAEALRSREKDILDLLFDNTESEEEGTRTVVAKCLGKFALLQPEDISEELGKRLTAETPLTRATIVTAIKFAIIDKPHPVDQYISELPFMKLLQDEDLLVRRSCLLTLNFAAHNKPSLIRPYLADNLHALYGETKVKEELIKVINLGPFKHKLDEGLENRKAAFECMYTLLDTCIDRIDTSEFILHVANGLTDVYDIKLLCHLMLSRLAINSPSSLVTSLDELVDPLKKTITTKLRDNAVKQQVDKNEEMIRTALVAVAAISALPDADKNVKFSDLVNSTIKNGSHASVYERLCSKSE